jgi:hypothetical protein
MLRCAVFSSHGLNLSVEERVRRKLIFAGVSPKLSSFGQVVRRCNLMAVGKCTRAKTQQPARRAARGFHPLQKPRATPPDAEPKNNLRKYDGSSLWQGWTTHSPANRHDITDRAVGRTTEQLAKLVDHGIAVLNAPPAIGGVLIALIVFTPEALSALRAALDNQLQRAVNLCLGAVSSTIGLTVPAILVIGLITGQSVVLGLPQPAWSFSRSHSCSARSRSADRPQPFWRARSI